MSDSPAENPTYEEALAELERIIHDLEDGQFGLEDALARYERGVSLIKRCYGQLNEAEQRILLLEGVDAEGKAVTRPFEHSASADLDRAEGKRRRKKPGESEGLY